MVASLDIAQPLYFSEIATVSCLMLAPNVFSCCVALLNQAARTAGQVLTLLRVGYAWSLLSCRSSLVDISLFHIPLFHNF